MKIPNFQNPEGIKFLEDNTDKFSADDISGICADGKLNNVPWSIIKKYIYSIDDIEDLETIATSKYVKWENILEIIANPPPVVESSTSNSSSKNDEKILRDILDWENVCLNPNIDYTIVKNNPDYPWDYTELSLNKNFTWSIIKYDLEYSRAHNLQPKRWSLSTLTYNLNLTWEQVNDFICGNYRNLLNGELDWNYLSSVYFWKKNNMNYEVLEKTIGDNRYKWDWEIICCNDCVSLDYIDKNYNRVVFKSGNSFQYTLGMTIKSRIFLYRSDITWSFFQKYLDKFTNDYYWDSISAYKNFDIETIEATFNSENKKKYNWDWNGLSKNPNITLQFITKYIKNKKKTINFNFLSENTFYNRKLYKKEIYLLLRRLYNDS